MWLQVLLLRLRQACVHPYLAQTKDDGSGTATSTEEQENAENSSGRSQQAWVLLKKRHEVATSGFSQFVEHWSGASVGNLLVNVAYLE